MSKVRQNKKIDIYKLADNLLNEIKPQVKKVVLTGSVSRKAKNPNDIDFVIIPKKSIPKITLKDTASITWQGDVKTQFELKNGIKVDVISTDKNSLGACLAYFIGPKWLNIRMRSIAKNKGLKLNEKGLFDSKGKKIAGANEKDIFDKLHIEYKAPEFRK